MQILCLDLVFERCHSVSDFLNKLGGGGGGSIF